MTDIRDDEPAEANPYLEAARAIPDGPPPENTDPTFVVGEDGATHLDEDPTFVIPNGRADVFEPPPEKELNEYELAAAQIPLPEPEEERRDRQLRMLWDIAEQSGFDAGILRLANESGADPQDVKDNYQAFVDSAKLGRRDPRKWRRENPKLYEMVVEHPELAGLVESDEKISIFGRAFRGIANYEEEAFSLLPPETLWSDDAAESEKAALGYADQFTRRLPLAVAEVFAGGITARIGALAIGELSGVGPQIADKKKGILYRKVEGLDTLDMVIRHVADTWEESEISELGAKAMRADAYMLALEAQNADLVELGVVSNELEQAREASREIHYEIIRRKQAKGEYGNDYGENTLQRVLLDISEGVTSYASLMKGAVEAGGKLGAVGAVVGGLAGARTLNPATALEGAVAGAKFAGGLGLKLGMMGKSFNMEGGGMYTRLLYARDDQGAYVDPVMALGTSTAYGAGASLIEMFTELGPLMKNPKALMINQGVRPLLKEFGKRSIVGMGGESVEEGAQGALEIGLSWSGTSLSAGQAQDFDPVAAGEQIVESAYKGGLAGGPISLPTQVLVSVSQYERQQETTVLAAAQIASIQKLADSDTARAAPVAVAKMVENQAAADGHPIDGVFIDPVALHDVAVENGLNPEQVVRDLFGDLTAFEAALADHEDTLGGRASLRIDVQEYLEKVGPKPIAELLVPHTTVKAGIPTLAELKKHHEAFTKEYTARAKELEEEGAWEPESENEQKLVSALEDQLRAVNKYTEEEVIRVVSLARAQAESLAKRAGYTSDQMMGLFSVKIEKVTERIRGAEAMQTSARPGDSKVTLAQREILEQSFAELDDEGRRRAYYRDANTGLLSKRGLEAVSRDPARTHLMVIDFEGFKFINDRFGHVSADGILRAGANVLRGLVPDAAKVGGSLAAFVDPAQEADIRATLQEAVGPDIRVVTATADASGKSARDAIEDAHAVGKEVKGRLYSQGKLGHRLGAPSATVAGQPAIAFEKGMRGLDPDSEQAKAILNQAAARLEPMAASMKDTEALGVEDLDQQFVDMFDAVDPQAAFDTVHIEAETGLLTEQGFLELRRLNRRKWVTSADLRGIRGMDQKFGRGETDAILELFGATLKELGDRFGLDVAHLHGDEYAVQSDDKAAVTALFREAARTMQRLVLLKINDDDGSVVLQQGVYSAYGTDKTFDLADRKRLPEAKAKQTGVPATRVFRGQDFGQAIGEIFVAKRAHIPIWVGDLLSQRDSGRDGLAQRIARELIAVGPNKADIAAAAADPTSLLSSLIGDALTMGEINARTNRENLMGEGPRTKYAMWKSVADEFLADESYPGEKEDGAYRSWMRGLRRPGEKPGPYASEVFDPVNDELEVKRPEDKVSGALESFDRLTAAFAQRNPGTRSTSIEATEYALGVMRGVKGLQSLDLPETVRQAQIEQRALDEEEYYKEKLKQQIDAERFDMDDEGMLVDKHTGEVLFSRAQQLMQKVWHGSPYHFERMDLSKIGAGEGFQAFGWGMYFADRFEISDKHYRERVSKRRGVNVKTKATVAGEELAYDKAGWDDDATARQMAANLVIDTFEWSMIKRTRLPTAGEVVTDAKRKINTKLATLRDEVSYWEHAAKTEQEILQGVINAKKREEKYADLELGLDLDADVQRSKAAVKHAHDQLDKSRAQVQKYKDANSLVSDWRGALEFDTGVKVYFGDELIERVDDDTRRAHHSKQTIGEYLRARLYNAADTADGEVNPYKVVRDQEMQARDYLRDENERLLNDIEQSEDNIRHIRRLEKAEKERGETPPESQTAQRRSDVGRAEAAIKDSKKELEDIAEGLERAEKILAALAVMKQGKKVKVTRPVAGQVYKVDVPEDHELLDYNAKLADQPEDVKIKLKAAGMWPMLVDTNNFIDPRTGESHRKHDSEWTVVVPLNERLNPLEEGEVILDNGMRVGQHITPKGKSFWMPSMFTIGDARNLERTPVIHVGPINTAQDRTKLTVSEAKILQVAVEIYDEHGAKDIEFHIRRELESDEDGAARWLQRAEDALDNLEDNPLARVAHEARKTVDRARDIHLKSVATLETFEKLVESEQHPGVKLDDRPPTQEALEAALDGKDLYHMISEADTLLEAVHGEDAEYNNDTAPKLASLALHKAGLPGLRFLDGPSRGKGRGSYNYVVWDEDRMPIVDKFYQPTWHGGARGIDNFQTKYMGSGQGDQVFGWGLYFADQQAIAEWYRETYQKRAVVIDGKPTASRMPDIVTKRVQIHQSVNELSWDEAWAEAAMSLRSSVEQFEKKRAELAEQLRDTKARNGDAKTLEALREAWTNEGRKMHELQAELAWLEEHSSDRVKVEHGQTYKVEVPEDDQLLDNELPLSQQPEPVKAKLKKAGLWPTVETYEIDVGTQDRMNDVIAAAGWSMTPGKIGAVVKVAGVELDSSVLPLGYKQSVKKDPSSIEELTGEQYYSLLRIAAQEKHDQELERQVGDGNFEDAMALLDDAGELVSDKAASLMILEAGVPGLRYLDGDSRRRGSGTHNYVVWDEDALSIVDRLYQKIEIDNARDNGQTAGEVAPLGLRSPTGASWQNGAASVVSNVITIREDTGAPISADGTINPVAVVEKLRLFQTREYQAWWDRFIKHPLVKETYSPETLAKLKAGMDMTSVILTDADQRNRLPPEFEGVSPIRDNQDFWKTFDISTICPRQDVFTATVMATERSLGRILDRKERYLVGLMIRAEGSQPSCWYCYGQAGRDAYDANVGRQTRVARAYVKLRKKKGGKAPTKAELREILGWVPGIRGKQKAVKGWSESNTLTKWLAANWKLLEKEGLGNEVRMRDIVRGIKLKGKKPTETELALAKAMATYATASTKSNVPKPWATLKDQILNFTANDAGRKNRIGQLNARAGLRMNSQTDFRPWHAMEMVEALAQMQAVGLTAHVYTKETDFLEAFGRTGIKFNLSALYRTENGRVVRDGEMGTFDNVVGMDGKDIERWVKELPDDVGGMLVAQNDEAFLLGLNDWRIHQIIPYHQGAVAAAVTAFEGARDYSHWQHEHWNNVETVAKGERYFTYKGKKYRMAESGGKAGEMIPFEYEGEKLEIEAGADMHAAFHKSDQARYFAICEDLGVNPKWHGLELVDPDTKEITRLVEKDENGHWQALHPEYMKLVRDVARDPNNQRVPNVDSINWEAIESITAKWTEEGGDALEADTELVQKVLDRIAKNDWPDKEMPSPERQQEMWEKRQRAEAKKAGQIGDVLRSSVTDEDHDAMARVMGEADQRRRASIFAQPQDDDPEVNRGYIEIEKRGGQRVMEIFLTESADISTPIHELGHAYLEMLGDLAQQPEMTQQIKDDYADALKYLGVESREDVGVAEHELWARSWEAYLMEGKAPSVKLASTFQRMRAWLLDKYKAVTALGVELDDNIRGVFDRLLATDKQIETAKAAMGGNTPFYRNLEEAKRAGRTKVEYEQWLKHRADADVQARLRVARKVAEAQRATMTKEWKAEVKKNRERAKDEYYRRPDVRAWRLLRKGERTNPDGSLVYKDLVDGKLDKKAVQQIAKRNSAIMNKLRGRLVDGGLSPKIVAQELGFPSGRDMLQALMARPDERQWLKERAEELTREQHPELALEKARVEQLASDALHDEGTSESLAQEWLWLLEEGRLPGMPAFGVLRDKAKARVDAMKLQRIPLEQIRTNERVAAEKSTAARHRGDFVEATAQKRQQILNHLTYREVARARADRSKLEALGKSLSKPKWRGKLGKGGRDFRQLADQILEALQMKKADPREKLVDPAQTMRKLEDMGMDLAFDTGTMIQVMSAPPANGWKGLTVAEARSVLHTLQQLVTAARDMNSMKVGEKRRSIEKVAAEIATDAAARPDRGLLAASPSSGTSNLQQPSRLRGIMANLADPQLIFEALGPRAMEVFWHDGYKRVREESDELTRKVTKVIVDNWDRLPKAMQDSRYDVLDDTAGVEIPDDLIIGGAVDRQWMWMVALNMGNESNIERLVGGYGWDEQNVRDWLNRNMKPEEWQFVQSVWDLLDKELYPLVSDTYEKHNGVKPPKIEPLPLQTNAGLLRGGYFPAKYDPAVGRRGAELDADAVAKMYNEQAGRTSVSKTFTKARADSYSDVVNLDWGVVPSHVVSVIHYVTHDQLVRDLGMLLQHPEMKRTIATRLGREYNAQLDAWLKAIASFAADAIPMQLRDTYWPLQYARSAFVISALGFSLTVAAGDLTNPLVSVTTGRVKARHMVPVLAKINPVYNPIGFYRTYKKVVEKSPEMRHRTQHIGRDLREALSQIGAKGRRSKVAKVIAGAQEMAFWLFEFTDKLAGVATWQAAYNQAKAAGKSELASVRFAEDAITANAPSFDIGQQSGLLRDKRGLGAMIVFFSYFSKIGSTLRGTWRPATDEIIEGEYVKAINPVAKACGRTIATFLVMGVLAELLSGRGKEDDEEWEEWVARKALGAPAMMVPIVGPIGEAGANNLVSLIATGELSMKRFSVRGSPMTGALDRIVRSLGKFIDDDAQPYEQLLAALGGLGVATATPIGSSQIQRTLGYALGDGLADDLDDNNYWGVASGLAYGLRDNQPENPITLVQKLLE